MSIPADRSRLRLEGHASTRVRSSSSPDSGVAAERLTDDLLVEILSRVPAKSLCRFKCVSNHWLSIINDPDHRKKLTQTLAGFFYNSAIEEPLAGSAIHFTSVSGSRSTLIDASFAFLPNPVVELLDCSNGLLLCCPYDASLEGDELHYIVCNPATEEWAELPDSGHEGVEVIARQLGFDPAVSPHFHVFILVSEQYGCFIIDGVDIYSSETGRWVHKKNEWNRDTGIYDPNSTVYLNGRLHFHAFANVENTRSFTCHIAAVDTKGERWTNIRFPSGSTNGFIRRSHGRLHYTSYKRDGDANIVRLRLYVLKDNDNTEWILRHSVETSSIFRSIYVAHPTKFYWIALHPDCNLIFFAVGSDMTLMCYDMDHGQVKVISDLEDGFWPYLPFVPLYTELQSLHK